MALRPLGNKIAVTRLAAQKETSSGIILRTSEEPDYAVVIAIGPDVDEVEIGEKLIINWNKATKIEDEDYVLSIDDVILAFENE